MSKKRKSKKATALHEDAPPEEQYVGIPSAASAPDPDDAMTPFDSAEELVTKVDAGEPVITDVFPGEADQAAVEPAPAPVPPLPPPVQPAPAPAPASTPDTEIRVINGRTYRINLKDLHARQARQNLR
jgi:hypothetical protein